MTLVKDPISGVEMSILPGTVDGTSPPQDELIIVKSPKFNLTVAAASTFGLFSPGFAGHIRALAVRPTIAGATGTARAVTARINGTPVTGGVVNVTAALTDVVDEYPTGSTITAANAFNADDQIDFSIAIEGTAFTAGQIEVILICSRR